MRIMLVGNSDLVIYNFRKELIISLLSKKNQVFLVSPKGEKIIKLEALGCVHYKISISRHSINPFKEIKTLLSLKKIISEVKPHVVLSFTIKPNIYSGLLLKKTNFIHIPNITGLGQVFSRNTLFRSMIIYLYKKAFKNSKVIFLQNIHDFDLFKKLNIFPSKLKLLPGSGVNVDFFNFTPYPLNDKDFNFLYLGRIMKLKGFDLFLNAAKFIKDKYPKVNFIVCGFTESGYEKILMESVSNGIILYKGNLFDVRSEIANAHCIIQPSFYPEGISNVILESSSMGRPVITSTNIGCEDAVLDNITGLIFRKKDLDDLIRTIERFLKLNLDSRIKMGLNARNFVEQKFNRDFVINAYNNYIYI